MAPGANGRKARMPSPFLGREQGLDAAVGHPSHAPALVIDLGLRRGYLDFVSRGYYRLRSPD
jgi:hypothetical protein